jgi:uncharacterized PurR-regulated membrane protein YhhQ (DUF165 family)
LENDRRWSYDSVVNGLRLLSLVKRDFAEMSRTQLFCLISGTGSGPAAVKNSEGIGVALAFMFIGTVAFTAMSNRPGGRELIRGALWIGLSFAVTYALLRSLAVLSPNLFG